MIEFTPDDVVIRRKLQYFDARANSNKFYEALLLRNGSGLVRWGRYLGTPQEQRFEEWSEEQLDFKINEKLRKGYVELDLHMPGVDMQPEIDLDARVRTLVDAIFTEAGESIKKWLSGSLDVLSQRQIVEGRRILNRFASASNFDEQLGAVEDYFRIIPTEMPRRIDPSALVQTFNMQTQEDRLKQLEAAISTMVVPGGDTIGRQYLALGADIKPIDPDTDRYNTIRHKVLESLPKAKIASMFQIAIPQEREAFDACAYGKKNVQVLFHGTRAHFVRHILKSGLVLPKFHTNGGRLGRGIYFADRAERSLEYAGWGRYGLARPLFMARVALGKSVVHEKDMYYGSADELPAGTDSAHGTMTFSGRGDEWVVYRAEQQSLAVLILVE
jgi:predicted DNA-binding WGR domain protein